MSIICGTGHRDILDGHHQLIKEQAKEILESSDGFFIGGARGFDSLMLSVACDLIEAGKHLPVSIVVPATAAQQPQEARNMIGRAALLGAKIVELGLPYTATALKERNRRMIDLAWQAGQCTLFAYWRGVYKSGTYSAIKYYWGSGAKDAQRSIQYIKL